jgi:ABC-2 type transport system permease protein
MTFSAELGLLFRLKRKTLKNSLTHLTGEKVTKFLLLLTLTVGFLCLDYLFFHRILSYLSKVPVIGTILTVRLLNMTFLTFFSMLLFSNILTALSTIYLSTDLSLLLSSPIRITSVFISKFIDTMLHSSWMILIFGFPIFMACGQVYEAPFFYYLLIPVILIPFLVIPASLGIGITVLLMRFFPAKRAQQVLTILGVLLAGVMVIFFRFLKPEQLIQEVGVTELLQYLSQSRIPSSSYLPSTWATEALMGIIEKKPEAIVKNLFLLGLGASLSFGFILRLATRFYYEGWSGSAESKTVKAVQWQTSPVDTLLSSFTFLHPVTRALLMKDLKIFWRDTSQWSQLLMLGALLIIYFFNIRNLPLDNIYLKNLVSFLNLGLAGFVLAALGSRFVYPTTSLEGESFWVLHSAPLDYRRFLLEKFFLFLFPLIGLAEVLVVVSNLLLKVDSYMMGLSVITIFFITLGLTGLGVGMGALYPKFINENPAQIATSLGGILYMICSLGYIGLIIVLEARPVYVHFSEQLFFRSIGGVEVYLCYGIALLISLVVTILPIRIGISALKNLEL